MSDLEHDAFDHGDTAPTAVGAGVVLVGGAEGKGKVSLADGVVERGLARLREAAMKEEIERKLSAVKDEAEAAKAIEPAPNFSGPVMDVSEPATETKNQVTIKVWSTAEIARRLQAALFSGSPTRRERELRAFANQVSNLQGLIGQMAMQYNAAADAANSARAAFMKLAEDIGPDEVERILAVGPEAPPTEPAPVSEEERALAEHETAETNAFDGAVE